MRKIKELDNLLSVLVAIMVIALLIWAVKGAWLFALDQYSKLFISIK